MARRIIILIILSMTFFAAELCAEKVEHKIIYYKDGSIFKEFTLKNGVKSGEEKIYQLDGTLKMSIMYEDGKKELNLA